MHQCKPLLHTVHISPSKHTSAGSVRGFGIASNKFHKTSRSSGRRGDPRVTLNMSTTFGSCAKRLVCPHNCCAVGGKLDICIKTSKYDMASNSVFAQCSAPATASAMLLSQMSLQKCQPVNKHVHVQQASSCSLQAHSHRFHTSDHDFVTVDSRGKFVCILLPHSWQSRAHAHAAACLRTLL